MIEEIGDFNVIRKNKVWVLKSRMSSFEYYLQPNEIAACYRAYDRQKNLPKLRLPDLAFTHHFALMRQSVYNQLKAIAYNGASREELSKLIIKFETDHAEKSGYGFLGIENDIRRNSLLRNLTK